MPDLGRFNIFGSRAPPPTADGSGGSKDAEVAAADSVLPDWLKDDSPSLPPWLEALENEPESRGMQTGFMIAWGGISTLAIGSGALLGYRNFETTTAYEALDKMEKPTVAAEAQAARMAGRAFALGTALACGSAGLAMVAAWALGLRSPEDVQFTAKRTLGPIDAWLRLQGVWLVDRASQLSTTVEGAFDGAAARWRGSALGGWLRGRVEHASRRGEDPEPTERQEPPQLSAQPEPPQPPQN